MLPRDARTPPPRWGTDGGSRTSQERHRRHGDDFIDDLIDQAKQLELPPPALSPGFVLARAGRRREQKRAFLAGVGGAAAAAAVLLALWPRVSEPFVRAETLTEPTAMTPAGSNHLPARQDQREDCPVQVGSSPQSDAADRNAPDRDAQDGTTEECDQASQSKANSEHLALPKDEPDRCEVRKDSSASKPGNGTEATPSVASDDTGTASANGETDGTANQSGTTSGTASGPAVRPPGASVRVFGGRK